MSRQGQAGGVLGNLKIKAFIGLEQAGSHVKLARDRAKVHDVENLTILRLVPTPQVHSQRAIKHRCATDIELIVMTIPGASRVATNLDQQRTTGILGEAGHVFNPGRITRADHTHIEQINIQRTTAPQHLIGSHPQGGVHEARLQRHLTDIE